jgi:glycosyltransferase involved in cell wall biosynthesis
VRRNVYLNYPISPLFGWGVYGLNLALSWANDPNLHPLTPKPVDESKLGIDPLRRRTLDQFLTDSVKLQAQLAQFESKPITISGPVLSHFEADFRPKRAAHKTIVSGQPTIAVTFFETAHLAPDAIDRAKAFPLVVAGSRWNADVLKARGVENVATVLQGVDQTLFHPAERSAFLRDRFLVFSGGKLERRKGQDLALAAFRKFAQKRPDALLVTAWHCPWPAYAKSLDASGILAPVPFAANGKVDVVGWARANGVTEHQIMDLGTVPNPMLPPILRDMDAAIFPNRAEGGTNLVAMEAMACGVPTVLSRNTGHIDLIEGGNCFPLDRQDALPGDEAGFGEVAGWGESDVDEIVDALDRIYLDRAAAREIGLAGAETLKRLSWAETARQMKAIVLDALPSRTDP